MPAQLDALTDEVFSAAAAQSMSSGVSRREKYGVIIRNPDYPDLFFMNGIDGLVAPAWSVSELEMALTEGLPGVRNLRAASRDPETIAALGPRLAAAGYESETRVAMVEVDELDGSWPPNLAIAEVDTPQRWADFEALARADGDEHQWSQAMTSQMIALHHWRVANTPHYLFLAYDGRRALAHVGLYQFGVNIYFHALFTHPSARRRGVGSALTRAMSSRARAMGGERLTLQCPKASRLPAFYQRLGFRAVGEQCFWTRPSS